MSYINKQYWDNFYKNNQNLNEASTFSNYILEKLHKTTNSNIIVDLGCGTGKDTFNFAKHNFDVIGIDGSQEVIKLNKSKVEKELSQSEKISFSCVDLSNKNQVMALMEQLNKSAISSGKNIVFYNRFFLHAIPEDVEKLIFKSINDAITVPFSIVAEFRTKEDEDLDKVYQDHYRRYVDTNDLIKRFLTMNLSLKEFSKGRGYSIYKNENPYLARLIIEGNKVHKGANKITREQVRNK